MGSIVEKNIYKISINLLLICCFIFLNACASDSRIDRLEDDQVKESDNAIDLIDSEIFDYKLGTSLTKNVDRVEVNIISSFNSNKIPERIEKWLSAVDINGGEIIMKPNIKQRGMISEVIDLVIIAYDAIKKNTLYAATEHYNAEVFYDVYTGDITKIEFVLDNMKLDENDE